MEKRRIRLEVDGVTLGLLTQETDEYMASLAGELSQAVEGIHAAAPAMTREAAALMVALGYCDDLRKARAGAAAPGASGEEASARMQQENARLTEERESLAREKALLEERVRRLEEENRRMAVAPVQNATAGEELAKLTEECAALVREKSLLEDEVLRLEEENQRLLAAARPQESAPAPVAQPVPAPETELPAEKRRGNPLRYEDQLDQMGLVSFFERDGQEAPADPDDGE